MFGGKKIKEAEDRIQELELVQKKQHQVAEDIQKTKAFTDEVFADLESQNLQIDQGMNHLLDSMREEQENIGEIAEWANNLTAGLSQIEEKSSQCIEENARLEEQLEKGKEMAAVLQETAVLCEEINAKEQEKKEKGDQAAAQISEELTEMRKSAKNMAALALNAAIEAGRLGETGMAFLQAAEEVRKLSESYMSRMDTLEQLFSAVGTLYQSETTSRQLEQLEQKTKEVVQSADALQTEHLSSEINLTEQVNIQQELVRELEERLQENKAAQQKILEQMEFIQQNHTDSRKLAGKLEERLALFYGKAL